MGDKTAIEWTDATWNPIRGCTRVSEGCRHCYAEGVAKRFSGPGRAYEGLVRIGGDGKPQGWSGDVHFVERHLLDPLKWKTPRRIFVNSMSDLFHENVTDEMRDRIFAVMALCPQHTFQVLTKRPERMRAYIVQQPSEELQQDGRQLIVEMAIESLIRQAIPGDMIKWPLPNVWLGVSVENQPVAKRVWELLKTPAAVRFISAEPLLGPLDLDEIEAVCKTWRRGATIGTYLDWVIVGGESGPGARPMHPDWVRCLRDQCAAAGVPFFFKQWGEWVTAGQGADFSRVHAAASTRIDTAGTKVYQTQQATATDAILWNVGKKAAGHLLDGVEHHAFPEVR